MYHLLLDENRCFNIVKTNETGVITAHTGWEYALITCIFKKTSNKITAKYELCEIVGYSSPIKLITSFPSLPFINHFPNIHSLEDLKLHFPEHFI